MHAAAAVDASIHRTGPHHCQRLQALLTNLSVLCAVQIIVAVAINGERPVIPEDCPPRLADLIMRCWREDPKGRPGVDELIKELDELIEVSTMCHPDLS